MDTKSYNEGWDDFKAGVDRQHAAVVCAFCELDLFAYLWGWDAAKEASEYVGGLFA